MAFAGPLSLLSDGVYPLKISFDGQPFLPLDSFLEFFLPFFSFFLIFLALDESFLITDRAVFLGFSGGLGDLRDMRSIGIEGLFLSVLEVILVKGKGVLELLGEVLVDGLAALQNRPSILEALDLFHDEADGIDFVFLAAVDGDDALPIFFLLVGKDFYHGSSRSLDDISDHVSL